MPRNGVINLIAEHVERARSEEDLEALATAEALLAQAKREGLKLDRKRLKRIAFIAKSQSQRHRGLSFHYCHYICWLMFFRICEECLDGKKHPEE